MSNDKVQASSNGMHPDRPLWHGDYNQTMLAAQHGWPTDTHKSPSKKVWALAISAFVIVVLIVAGTVLQNSDVVPAGVPLIGKDSGIAACEAIASQSGPIASQKSGQQMTEAEYRRLRSVFDESRYPEIGEPGIRVVDLAWQIQGMGEDAGLALLPMVGPLTESYGALTGGCAQHGITIPTLGSR